MHIHVLARGIKQDVDRFVKELESKYLPFPRKNIKTGITETAMVQVGVRVAYPLEIIFPKECKDIMLNTLFGDPIIETQHKPLRRILAVMRKLLGIKKIENEERKDKSVIPIYNNNAVINAIGIKEDKMMKDGDFEYEAL